MKATELFDIEGKNAIVTGGGRGRPRCFRGGRAAGAAGSGRAALSCKATRLSTP